MALDTATACRFVGFTRSWINEDLESNRPLLPKLELDLGKATTKCKLLEHDTSYYDMIPATRN